MVNYGEALKRPFTDIKALIIGIVLLIIPVILGFLIAGSAILPGIGAVATLDEIQDPQQVLNILSDAFLNPQFLGLAGLVAIIGLIINWIVGGYYYRCIKSMLGKTKKKFVMPEWVKFGDLFVKGLLMFLLGVIYFIIIMVLLILTAITIVGPFILMLLFAYLMPCILISFVQEGKFSGGFKFKRIFKKAFTGSYFLAWLFSIVVVIILGIIGSIIPVVGGSIAGFLSMIIGITVLTEAYTEKK